MIPQYTYRYKGLRPSEIAEHLHEMVYLALRDKYDDKPDDAIVRRIDEEWTMMEACGCIYDIAALYELSQWLREQGCPCRAWESAGSSIILYLLGITRGNPLPPHRWCPACKRIEWAEDCLDGFDLPQGKLCERDGAYLVTDGHDIAHQMLFGYDGQRPIFRLDMTYELFDTIRESWASHWLRETADDVHYLVKEHSVVDIVELSRIRLCFLPIKAVPPELCSYEYGAREIEYMLERAEWILDLREWRYPDPTSFADMVSLSGLDYADIGSARNIENRQLLDEGYVPSELIAFCDDIYRILRRYGIDEKEAWRAVESVRRGEGLPALELPHLTEREERILSQCRHIDRLCYRAGAVEDILYKLRTGDY